LQRQGLACVYYFAILVISLYLVRHGALQVPLGGLLLLYGVALVFNALFLTLITTGRNLRLRDPSLTRVQIVLYALMLLFLFGLSQTSFAQSVYFFAFLLTILFAGFQQTALAIATEAGLIFLGFVAVIVWRGHLQGPTPIGIFGRAAIYAVLLSWTVLFASYVSRLRRHLASRNQDLRATMSDLRVAMRKIENLAVRDELTGAYNRRFIRDTLAKEMERAMRTGMPFSVCMLDVDHFKRINDGSGHLVGDTVLRALVERIMPRVRELDRVGYRDRLNLLARFGGEEFLLVLPGTNRQGAWRCAERVREAIEHLPFETDAGALPVTISGGVAEYVLGDTVDTLLARADGALYKAKGDGRNQIAEAA
jgi:diguanylate cyclase (GGDEF)-like protein